MSDQSTRSRSGRQNFECHEARVREIDIILVGEMRDEETFMTASAAEAGHLVFGTVHASSSSTTIGVF